MLLLVNENPIQKITKEVQVEKTNLEKGCYNWNPCPICLCFLVFYPQRFTFTDQIE